MKTHATATFTVKSWDEKTWEGKPHKEVTGAKLTHANMAFTYQGDLMGEGVLQYLLSYGENGATGHYVGLERITGALGSRSGSFVLQHQGTFAGHSVQGDFSVLPGSGTGDLQDLRGAGTVKLQAEPWSITIVNYEFA